MIGLSSLQLFVYSFFIGLTIDAFTVLLFKAFGTLVYIFQLLFSTLFLY